MYALTPFCCKPSCGFLRQDSVQLVVPPCKCPLGHGHFFDDFVSLSREAEKVMLDKVALGFFRLLGWKVFLDKDAPFSKFFEALGIWVSFERFLQGEHPETDRRGQCVSLQSADPTDSLCLSFSP